jgi:hypothetical protein
MASATKNMMISESPNIPKVYFSDPTVLATSFDKVLGFIVTVLDYMLGMVMGGIGGWVIGYCLGHIVLDMFEPARLESIEAIEYWYYLPLTFGRYGAMIAACISIPVFYAISKKRVHRQITEYCETLTIKTDDFEKDTGVSSSQIEKEVA